MKIRTARPDDLPTVMNILDGALLAVDAATVRERIENTTVLVAVEERRVLGALVLDGREIEAIAVRRARRGQEIGTELVAAAIESADGELTAEFHRRVRPFYESFGFAIEPTNESNRFRGVVHSTNATQPPAGESSSEHGHER